MVTLVNYALLSNSFIEHNRWRGKKYCELLPLCCVLRCTFFWFKLRDIQWPIQRLLLSVLCGVERRGKCVIWRNNFFFWVICILRWDQQVIVIEFTVYSKLIVGSPKVNDQWPEWTSDPPLLASGWFFFLFLKSKSFSYEVWSELLSACVWKSLFPVLWNYPGIILQCHVVAWFLSSLLGPKG